MRGNPLDWQLAQLQTVARQNGIGWRHAGTSHCVFVRNDGKTLFSDCLSDGESVEEAITNGQDALKSTIAALKAKELPIPAPNSGGVASGKFVARVPKTVHARLATRAKAEGVSLNTLVLTFIAEGLGRKERRA